MFKAYLTLELHHLPKGIKWIIERALHRLYLRLRSAAITTRGRCSVLICGSRMSFLLGYGPSISATKDTRAVLQTSAEELCSNIGAQREEVYLVALLIREWPSNFVHTLWNVNPMHWLSKKIINFVN